MSTYPEAGASRAYDDRVIGVVNDCIVSDSFLPLPTICKSFAYLGLCGPVGHDVREGAPAPNGGLSPCELQNIHIA